MFNLIISGLLFIGIIIWICIKLKNWKQRSIFLLVLFVVVPASMLYWFRWGWNNREERLMKAQVDCRQHKVIDGLQITFTGFTEKEFAGGFYTNHKDSTGLSLDSDKQKVDSRKLYDGSLSANYSYPGSFRTNDALEIRVGNKIYILSNFILTASANYNMGGAVVNGCRIDSADVNGKRTALDQNMFIHKTDQY